MSETNAPKTNWLGHPVKGELPPPGGAPRDKRKKNPRNAWYKRLDRFIETNLVWVIIGTLIGQFLLVSGAAFFINTDAFNLLLLIGTFIVGLAIQLAIIAFLAIFQFVAILWFMSRSKMEFIKPGDSKMLTLADYKGQKQLVTLVKQWIQLLSDRTEFKKMGGNFINGLLLYGPPGTGKTMLAKCMAGEAGIAFISMEGSGFRGMFWGVDVMKMIFFCGRAKRLARQYGACIAFIDEIDAVGASRGNVMGGGGFWGGMGAGAGSLTRLLYEMDGISELSRWEKIRAWLFRLIGKKPPVRDWHVLYMGSTNRPDVLDPALTRPGRFDRMIAVEMPDKTGRREIIDYYLSKVSHDETVDVEALVADTQGTTPARIMSAITKDAVRIALFSGRKAVSQRDIDLAFQEQYFGLENPIEEMEEDQKRVIAYHEAGHAITQYHLMPDSRIVRATIIRRGRALGYVLPVDTKEWHQIPLRRYVLEIMVYFAGRASEKVFFGEPFNSVGGDYPAIMNMLRLLVTSGMFGPPMNSIARDPSGMIGVTPDRDMQKRLDQYWTALETQVEQLLRDHAGEVHAVANALFERQDLSGKELTEIIEAARAEALARGEPIPEGLPPMIMQLLPEHQRQPTSVEELEPAPASAD